MDGENKWKKPYFLMDDLGVPLFLETPICMVYLPIHEGMTFYGKCW